MQRDRKAVCEAGGKVYGLSATGPQPKLQCTLRIAANSLKIKKKTGELAFARLYLK
jgi:hypothetical protein